MRRYLLPTPNFQPPRRSYVQDIRKPYLTGGFTTPQKSNRPATFSEDEFPIVKSIFQIIKCEHHLASLLSGPPPSLKRKAASLQSQLHPAFIDDDFRTAVKQNADCWLLETVETLRRHYHGVIEKASCNLKTTYVPMDCFERCISHATHWARNQLGRKLNLNQLDATLTFVRSLPPQLAPVPEIQMSSSFSLIEEHKKLTSTATQTDELACTSVLIPEAATQEVNVSPDPTTDLSQQALAPSVSTPRRDDVRDTGSNYQNVTPSTNKASRKRQRHNSSSPGTNLSQLDIFMTPLSQPRRTSSLPDVNRTLPTTDAVIFGDTNVEGFSRPNTSIFAKQNGKLSHFKSMLSSDAVPNQHVKKFVLCLSTLDASNTLSTNSSTLKSVLGAAHRVFPQAKLFVQLLGIDQRFPETLKSNIEALNTFVINKHPSSSFHIPPDPDFVCSNHEWNEATKRRCFEKISQYLN